METLFKPVNITRFIFIFLSFLLIDKEQMPRNLVTFVELLCRVENIPLLGLSGLAALTKEAVGFPVLMLAIDRAAPESSFGRLNNLVNEIWNRSLKPVVSDEAVMPRVSMSSDASPVKSSADKKAVVLPAVPSWQLARRPDGQPAFVVSSR